jgi:CRP-like cAMP-binding protein
MLPILVPSDAMTLSLFAGLTQAEKETLLAGGHIHKYPPGQMLFLHGDPVEHFYIVTDGTVQLFRETVNGQEKTVHIANAGQTMCEGEILDGCKFHRMSAVAVKNAAVMEFPVMWLKDAARKHESFALNLLSLVAQKAYMAEVEAEHQASMSASQLVACFLQRLCVLYEHDPKGFELPYSKTLIASRLGMEVETFSRTLPKLKDHGIVVNGSHVTIQDLNRIEEYVCQACSVSEDCSTHKAMKKKLDEGEKRKAN